MKKKMMMAMMLLMAISMVLGSFARASSLELAASKEEALSTLIEYAGGVSFENNPDAHVSTVLAKALLVGTAISGQCVYMGKSMIQRCSINIMEGASGEGLGGKLHVFTFDLYGEGRAMKHLRYQVAL